MLSFLFNSFLSLKVKTFINQNFFQLIYFTGGHNQASHQDSSHESGGMLSQMGSTFFGEENVSHSLLPPGAHAPADSSSPSLMARSLLGKLAIRKPSILSITSNLSSPGGNGSGGENKNGHFGGSLEDVEKGGEMVVRLIC